MTKLEIKAILSQSDQYLCFTTDMWISICKRGYMVMNGQLIGNKSVMRHLVICFTRVKFSHTAECLAQYLCGALSEMKIVTKFWTITTHNASTNLLMVSFLKNRLDTDRSLPLSEDRRICCLTNVLHLTIDDSSNSLRILNVTIAHLCDITNQFCGLDEAT